MSRPCRESEFCCPCWIGEQRHAGQHSEGSGLVTPRIGLAGDCFLFGGVRCIPLNLSIVTCSVSRVSLYFGFKARRAGGIALALGFQGFLVRYYLLVLGVIAKYADNNCEREGCDKSNRGAPGYTPISVGNRSCVFERKSFLFKF